MKKEVFSKINFEKYLIQKTIFEINDEYKSTNQQLELDLEINNEIEIDEENSIALIKINCLVFKDSKKNNFPFTLEVSIVGFFEYETKSSIEEIFDLLEINGSSILFPYLRSYITTITSNAGIPPLIIPTLNIVELLKENKKNNL